MLVSYIIAAPDAFAFVAVESRLPDISSLDANVFYHA